MPRMLLRTAWFVAVLAAGATVGAAWAWRWAAGYEPDICDDEPEEGH